jgi:hypothetical protein
MIRTRLTWVTVGAIAALLLVAGTVARCSSGSSSASGSGSASTTPGETAALDVCGPQQLMFRIERLGRDPALSLRNVSRVPCRAPRLPITLTLLDRGGSPAEATTVIQPAAFPPATYSPNVEEIARVGVFYKCAEAKPQTKPKTFVAEAGSYHVEGRLPAIRVHCL